MAQVMVHRTAPEALQAGADLVKAARDLDEGVARDLDEGVAVDVCLADASRADHALVAHHARVMTGAGAGLVVLADTVGAQLPYGCGEMFRWVRAETGSEVMLASHLHNDLGLGLANTLQALGAGVRVVSASWLGIAERAGMVATEQLLFLLAQHSGELLGEDAAPWWIPPDLTRLPVIAQMVAAETGVPLSVTTPIVGTGVGSLSTGTPFVHPRLFQPYDPQEVLGITPRVVLTHLASARVVTAVATRLGHTLGPVQTRGDGLGETARLPHRRGRGRGRRLRRIPRRPHPPGGWRHTVSPDAAAAREAAGMDDARRALREGTAVVLPNPAPLTHVVTAIRPHTVNEAKARPPGSRSPCGPTTPKPSTPPPPPAPTSAPRAWLWPAGCWPRST
ncbi:hypothetical protein [Streptomyces sp. TE33382]